jgi:(1->4)-alpha-D-glucan 1-alpha-D-glucosylmutase
VYVKYFEHLLPVSEESLETIGAAEDLERLNRDPEKLDRFLERQHYRMVLWRTVGSVLGYRRFFDINSMVALRMADPEVFEQAHGLVLSWVEKGELQGLRIDHPDGLRDPEGYFAMLRERAPDAWIVAEKVLLPGERLKQSWPVAGTTGYEFLNQVSGLFVHPGGEQGLDSCYRSLTGETRSFDEVLRQSKREAVRSVLGGGLNRLTALLAETCESSRVSRDFVPDQLRDAIAELTACLPVYRTYIDPAAGKADEQDAHVVAEAARQAKAEGLAHAEVIDYLADLLLLRQAGPAESEFVLRFQQFTGPAMAKGGEDTALYRYFRLVSLNEVGSDPGIFGTRADDFHRAMSERAARHPSAMLATSTHDTKRSEDVRARLHLLSEIPGEWARAVSRWFERNERYKEGGYPDRNAEYLLYQTLVGAWPINEERTAAYMEKAVKESKTFTSWTDPDPAYEEALRGFIAELFADRGFLEEIETFTGPLVYPGRVNSLSQTLIKLTAPGVPDLYQGTEVWDLSLVDPDNRRPVDFDLRGSLLREINTLTSGRETLPENIMQRMDTGLPKLWVTVQALRLRTALPGLFGPGSVYRPLETTGEKKEHLIAFERSETWGENDQDREAALTIVQRWPIALGGEWGNTSISLPGGEWENTMTGIRHAESQVGASELFSRFPVALLARPGRSAF